MERKWTKRSGRGMWKMRTGEFEEEGGVAWNWERTVEEYVEGKV